jgi:prephenate dehydrogenase
MKINRIAIIGAGQIGTSLVMQILEKHPDAEIVALDVNPDIKQEFFNKLTACGFNEKAQARVKFTTNPNDIVDPEIVILATPISEFGKAVGAVQPRMSSNTLLIDIGSVKEESIKRVHEVLIDKDAYVPGHIFNGNSGFGPKSASTDVFHSRPTDGSKPEAKPFFLIPQEPAKPGEDQRLTHNEKRAKAFVASLGSKPFFVSAPFHDEIVGTLSHLEYVIVYALMRMPYMQEYLQQRGQVDPGNAVTAILRIAQAHPDMWIAIFKDNRENILKTAEHFRRGFSEIENITDVTLDELHEYAKDKPTPRVSEFIVQDYQGHDLRFNALVGMVSLAIADNSRRLEAKTGQKIADVANPSYKDGLGLTAKARYGLFGLLVEYGRDTDPLRAEFQTSFDNIVSLIRDLGIADRAEAAERELRKIIVESGEDHKNLARVFDVPETKSRHATPAYEPRCEKK